MKKNKWLYLLAAATFLTNSFCLDAQVIEDENVLREIKTIVHKGFDVSDSIIDEHIDFNDGWKFKLGDNLGFEAPEFDDSGWRTLDVPHDWSIEGKPDKNNPASVKGGFYPTGKGCYRKTFILDKAFKGKRVKIKFDGVYMNSKVYVNGNYVGNRPYGFSTFEYDISRFMRYGGGKNVIAVSVDKSLQQSCRLYTGTGINRRVHLTISEQQHFDYNETFFRTVALKDNAADVKVDCKVISHNYPESERIRLQLWPDKVSYTTKKARVDVVLKDMENRTVVQESKDFMLRDYSERDFSFEMTVPQPRLWSAETPELYNLELTLNIDGKKVNTENHRVGIRMITFDCNNGMSVNGKKVIAKGVCLHKDAGSFGTAVPREMWVYRLEKLKEMGCNAIRAHGPVDPIFIDVCDELGFYMMCEAFDEWEKNWEYGLSEGPTGKLAYTYHKFFNPWAETDLKDMIRRDRNHPSVFMYSIGNEVPEQRFPDGARTLNKLKGWAHETDNTRPVTVGCDWSMWANQNGFMDAMDIAGYNYPERYYPQLYVEQHKQYPNRIILGTETNLTLRDWLAVRDNPFVVGLFLWVGIDYIGECLYWPRRSWEWGLIDIASFPKPYYYIWQSYWSDQPNVRIAVYQKGHPFKWDYRAVSHWNFDKDKKEQDTVFVITNQPEVELFLNGKSLGKKQVDSNEYRAKYVVSYQPGELKAVAYNAKGKKVNVHSIRTAEEPEKLAIINQRKNAVFENGETLFLAVEVQDKEGTCHPKADNEINVNVEGGELLGLDSGDPFSHELFKQNNRKAFEGKVLVTVKIKDKDAFKVSCSSDGLESAVWAIKKK